MKRRVRKIANFFAFNLLFFALYLNFIHKDKAPVSFAGETATQQNTAAFSGSSPVDNPQENKQPAKTQPAEPKAEQGTAALKLSIN
ncbi:MAG: hypothetical protein ACT4OJ_04695 [Bacteroidota bacterium]